MKISNLFYFVPLLMLSFQRGVNPGPTLPAFDTYCNARFGYCIHYPKDLLYPQREAYNGDGRVFKNKAGITVLTVYGRINQDMDGNPISLQRQFEQDVASFKNSPGNGTITYKKSGKGFYVLSGHRTGKIYYQKTIIKGDAFCFALLEYDNAEKPVYDGIAGEIFRSFK